MFYYQFFSVTEYLSKVLSDPLVPIGKIVNFPLYQTISNERICVLLSKDYTF